MKTLYKSIFVTLILFATSLISVYVVSKSDFQNKMEKISLNSENLWFGYSIIFEGFFTSNFRYPSQLEELYSFYSYDTIIYEKVFNRMKDPFSKMNKDLLYVPVYSKFSKLCEGFLLISAGIDGKLNNRFNDTIYFEDIIQYSFYNPFDAATSLSYREYRLKYKLRDFIFGNNDLLIEFSNGIDIFIDNSSQRIFTPTTLMEKLYPKGFSRFDCCVEGLVKSIDSNKIVIVDSQSNVVCSMYSGRAITFKESEKVKIVGQYRNRLDTLSKTIFLENCISINR
jgi:hypothetical protein